MFNCKKKCKNCTCNKGGCNKDKQCNSYKVKPDWRYCGDDIDCAEIKKGDKLPDIINKIANVACEGGDGANYTFEENEECENGGITVRKDEDIVYQTCYPCCGDTPTNKEYFYEEIVSFVDFADYDASNYFFPTGYEILEYENTKSTPMTVEVHASYNTFITTEPPVNLIGTSSAYNDVQSAIIKTDTSSIDTPQYTAGGINAIGLLNYDVATGQPITSVTPDKVLTSPSGHVVQPVLSLASLFQTINIFKVLTLQPGEKTSLKFVAKNTDTVGRVQSAQILVKEL